MIDGMPSEVYHPTCYSAIIAQAQLAKIADSIYHQFLLAKTASTKVDYSIAESMERDLSRWRSGLPSFFTSSQVDSWFLIPRTVVLWKEQNLHLLIWRGSKSQHGFLPELPSAISHCTRIAMQIIHDIATFCAEQEEILHQNLRWYATYFIFQAVLVLGASRFIDNEDGQGQPQQSSPRPWEHSHSLSKAQSCLQLLARSSRPAVRCLHILNRLQNTYSPGTPFSPGNEQPVYNTRSASRLDAALSDQNVQVPIVASDDPSQLNYNWEIMFDAEYPDPIFYSLISEVPSDVMSNLPVDLLLNEWAI